MKMFEFIYLFQFSNFKGKEHRLLEAYDWYILPIVNPDGYVYTHTTVRGPVILISEVMEVIALK